MQAGPADDKLTRAARTSTPGCAPRLALVARNGDPLTGSVTRKLKLPRPRRQHRDQRSTGRGRFERITAVLVNADGRVSGFSGGDWVYSKDGVRFRASVRR